MITAVFDMSAVSVSTGQAITSFAEPVTVTLTVPPETLAAAAGGGQVTLQFFNEATNQWQAVPATLNANGTLSAQITHFSKWALIVVKPMLNGSVPKSGYGLVVYAGGSLEQLVTATGCPRQSMALWAASKGDFVAYVPGTSVGVVNTSFLALYPQGTVPQGTPFLGRC